jgi:hypothetical protein
MVCHVIGRLGNPTLISLHVTKQNGLDEKKTVLQDVQKAPPARPQRVKARGVPSGYVEGLNDARTKLAGFFNTRYSAMMLEPGDFILKI